MSGLYREPLRGGQPRTKFRRQSPELVKQRFSWFNHQVLPDPKLPASAKLVAYRIGEGFNDIQYDGEAFESCKNIGIAIGMSEATVIEMVGRLHTSGHLRVEWGQQGRKHPNNYWLILKPASAQVSDDEIKPQPAKVSDEIKPQPTQVLDEKIKPQPTTGKPQSAKIKPQPTKIKPQPAKENHTTNQEENHGRTTQRAPSPDFSSLAGSKPAPAAVSSDEPAAGFKEFWSIYPKSIGEQAAEKEYNKALQRGVTAEEINAGARLYAKDSERIERSRESNRYTKDPANWLKEGRWTDKPIGVTLDENGNPVAASRPWKTNGHHTSASAVAEQVKAAIRANGGRA